MEKKILGSVGLFLLMVIFTFSGCASAPPAPDSTSSTSSSSSSPDSRCSSGPAIKIMSLFNAADTQKALDTGADINACVTEDKTALMSATALKNIEVAKLLLEKGAKVDARTKDNWTALMMAANTNVLEIAGALLEKGADPNATTGENGFNSLLLAIAQGNLPMVQLLVEKGAKLDVNARIEKKWVTPLLLAIGKKSLPIVQFLVEKGADVNFVTPGGMTALATAQAMELKEIADYLAAHGAK